jgi:N-acyl-D-amino-acid deacylase
MHADLIFRSAQLADGKHPVRASDVAVEAGRIAAVGQQLPIESYREEIEARGLLLCPGFIDMHAHSALRPFLDPWQVPKVAQGFTTEVICPDGLGPAPVTPAGRVERCRYLSALEGPGPAEWSWESLSDYLTALEATHVATNLVASVPHSAVRDVVLGPAKRTPDDDEVRRMQHEVGTGFAAGARMLSFGLIYAPGLYADTAEITALARVAAEQRAPLMPHVRNEAAGVLDAIGEFVRVAEHTGAALHLSHLKLVGSAQLLDDLLRLIADAAQRIDLSFDHYPYGAGSTLLSALLPPWTFDGGPAGILRRLQDRAERLRILRDMERGLPGWENLYAACGPARITITEAGEPRGADVGKTIVQIASERGVEPPAAVLDLLTDTELNVGMVDHYASEQVVQAIFALPGALVGSDGIFNAHPHPRLYGTAARVLGRYALRDGLVAVEEAVARLTSRAADRLGLHDRGRIEPGLRADLVLLDPDIYIDTATYDRPRQTPPGVRRVLVAGRTVFEPGRITGQRPGTVTRTVRADAPLGTHGK